LALLVVQPYRTDSISVQHRLELVVPDADVGIHDHGRVLGGEHTLAREPGCPELPNHALELPRARGARGIVDVPGDVDFEKRRLLGRQLRIAVCKLHQTADVLHDRRSARPKHSDFGFHANPFPSFGWSTEFAITIR